jgi:hypothetical protein
MNVNMTLDIYFKDWLIIVTTYICLSLEWCVCVNLTKQSNYIANKLLQASMGIQG